jgi:hypothetical protein
VAVAVVSLGITVWLFTRQEDLSNQAERAEQQAQSARDEANRARNALSLMATEVLGQTDVSDPAAMSQQVLSAKRSVVQSDALKGVNIGPQASVIDILDRLADAYESQRQTLQETTDQVNNLDARMKQMAEEIAQRKDTYDQNAAELMERVQALETQTAEARKKWQEQVAQLEQRLSDQAEEAGQQVAEERQLRQQLEDQLAKERERSKGLQQELAAFKPQPDLYAALQRADGRIVRAMPGDDVVYINLGRNDGVSRGMTFAVYPRLEGISADGKGKATIEVVQVFDKTSECKVTSTTAGQPVIKDDLIANPVFDRSRQYRFVIAGGFDLDFDGKIDDPNGERVATMIRNWGGIVTGEVDTSTDFLVAGVPVTRVAQPAQAEPEATEVRQAQAEERRKAFESKLQEARSLSIPILTRTQFLHFVGQPLDRDIPDDTLSAMQ